MQPSFEARHEQLKLAAQSTCYVVGKGPQGIITGTAFFIGPSTLITAGHVAHKKGTKLVAQLPGTLVVEPDAGKLWKGGNNLPPTFECTVKKSLYREPPSDKDGAATFNIDGLSCMKWAQEKTAIDIAILDCSKRYEAKHWLSLETGNLRKDSLVDIVGYPGYYTLMTLRRMFDGVNIDNQHVQDATELLPRSELIISHGKVIESGDNPTYIVSTIGGMSGAPVIVDGKAVGTSPLA